MTLLFDGARGGEREFLFFLSLIPQNCIMPVLEGSQMGFDSFSSPEREGLSLGEEVLGEWGGVSPG